MAAVSSTLGIGGKRSSAGAPSDSSSPAMGNRFRPMVDNEADADDEPKNADAEGAAGKADAAAEDDDPTVDQASKSGGTVTGVTREDEVGDDIKIPFRESMPAKSGTPTCMFQTSQLKYFSKIMSY